MGERSCPTFKPNQTTTFTQHRVNVGAQFWNSHVVPTLPEHVEKLCHFTQFSAFPELCYYTMGTHQESMILFPILQLQYKS